jgi:purine-binding chemotaxis protein CheW
MPAGMSLPGIASGASASVPREFLTFRLGAQEYGIDAQKVREIRGCRELEGIEDAPECYAGAMDLGGAKVPVTDLRVLFELNRAADSIFTVAIILDLEGRALGLMVDSVSDVLRLARRHIRPAPESWTGPDAQYLIGIGTDDERRLNLLDIEKLMLGEGMGLLEIEAC